MIPVTRRKKILELLNSEEFVYLEQLAKVIGTSEQTIRRDLMYLENEGLVERFHGGAAKLVDTRKELSVDQRMQRFNDAKEIIGLRASECVEPGDVVFLDGGTTTAAMLTHLKNKDITVFTNGIMHLQILERMDIPAYVIGGKMKRRTGCFIGPIALRAIKRFNFDKVFIGTNGISLAMGCSNADIDESELKALLIRQSKKAYVLCDDTKFGIDSLHHFSDLDNITVITNNLPDIYKEAIDDYIVADISNEK